MFYCHLIPTTPPPQKKKKTDPDVRKGMLERKKIVLFLKNFINNTLFSIRGTHSIYIHFKKTTSCLLFFFFRTDRFSESTFFEKLPSRVFERSQDLKLCLYSLSSYVKKV